MTGMDDWHGGLAQMTGTDDWHGRLAWMTGVHGLSWTEFYILITDRQTNRLTDGHWYLLSRYRD